LEGQHIVKVGGGEHFSIAMNIQGSAIWSWGRADYGQLGRFDVETDSGHFESTPKLVQFPDTSGDGKGGALLFADIDASDRSASVISDQGDVYTWGFGETGVTGVDGSDLLRPQKLNIASTSNGGQDKAIVHNVSGGGQHTLMVISY
jgi:alpha-tubulin suppressor-like RCC1 family protein